MKKQFLNLGKVLNKAEQKQINGGELVYGNPGPYYEGTGSTLGGTATSSCGEDCGWIVDRHTGAQLFGVCLQTTYGGKCIYTLN